MKLLLIILSVVAFFYAMYYFSPVDYQTQTPKIWCEGEAFKNRCKNTCFGVPSLACNLPEVDMCFDTCAGKCYGAVTSNCRANVRYKLSPLDILNNIVVMFQ